MNWYGRVQNELVRCVNRVQHATDAVAAAAAAAAMSLSLRL